MLNFPNSKKKLQQAPSEFYGICIYRFTFSGARPRKVLLPHFPGAGMGQLRCSISLLYLAIATHTHTGKIQRVSRQQLIISSGPTPTLTLRHTLRLLSLSTYIFASNSPPPFPRHLLLNLGYISQFRQFHKGERHFAMFQCILCFKKPNFTSRDILTI